MTISTQDCKDFILSISHIIYASSADVWKRTKKYKDSNIVLRDFENQHGRKLTIAEISGNLFLYNLDSLATNIVLTAPINIANEKGRKYIGHAANEKDVFKFMAECVKADNTIVDDEDAQTVTDAIDPSSWTIWQTWSKKIKDYDLYNQAPLDSYFEDNDGDWGEFELFYPDKNGDALEIVKKDIIQIFWVGMNDYDTAYRIYVFETYDHQLWLGCNNPD